ncbi:MAG: hypothetical protein ACC644_02850 [Candidatus Hydrothermarchaeales archaeon]
MEGMKKIKKVAEDLKTRDVTVNVIYKGKAVFRIGADAKPGLLSMFGDVEVLDLKKTAEIFNVLF